MPLIVFDLDGTLIDSRRDIVDSANEMLQSYGAAPRPEDEVAGMVGEGAKMLVARALVAAGVHPEVTEALGRFKTIYDRRLLNHTVPYEGVRAAVEAVAGRAALAVLSNKPEAPTRRLLDAFELTPFFGRIVGGDSAFPRKPDPASLRDIMAGAGANAASTLLVGDSMVDVETARRGGVAMCVVLYGFGALRGDLVLTPAEQAGVATRPSDLIGALDRFLAAAALSGKV